MYLGIIISNSFKFWWGCFQETFQGFSLVFFWEVCLFSGVFPVFFWEVCLFSGVFPGFFLGSLFVFRCFPLFIFIWQELFFATLPDWPYWQKGANANNSWVGDSSSYGQMLQNRKKSKGRKRVERGQKYGYSNTQRVGGAGLAADASGQGFSKAAAAAPPEPAVPAAEPVVPPAAERSAKRTGM